MLTYHEINAKIKEILKMVAEDQDIVIGQIEDHHAIVDDLGFSSLDVAVLAAHFEEAFKVDPFTMGVASVTSIRTVKEVSKAYEKALKLKG